MFSFSTRAFCNHSRAAPFISLSNCREKKFLPFFEKLLSSFFCCCCCCEKKFLRSLKEIKKASSYFLLCLLSLEFISGAIVILFHASKFFSSFYLACQWNLMNFPYFFLSLLQPSDCDMLGNCHFIDELILAKGN